MSAQYSTRSVADTERASYLSTDSTIASSFASRKHSMDTECEKSPSQDNALKPSSTAAVSNGKGQASSEETFTLVQNSLIRLQNHKLAAQRFVVSDVKAASMHSVALGARIDHALSYRMSDQDATFSRPSDHQSDPNHGQSSNSQPKISPPRPRIPNLTGRRPSAPTAPLAAATSTVNNA